MSTEKLPIIEVVDGEQGKFIVISNSLATRYLHEQIGNFISFNGMFNNLIPIIELKIKLDEVKKRLEHNIKDPTLEISYEKLLIKLKKS